MFNTFFELIKIKVAVLISLSTIAGYMLSTNKLSFEIFIPAIAIFFLSCGASALNQFQERKLDFLMERTKKRPIPAEKIQPKGALCIALLLIFIGLFIFWKTNLISLYLSTFAIFWYNAVYTNLKKKTSFAIIPGAIVGAIPVYIGWIEGGGQIFDTGILLVAIFFFLWQLPHFFIFNINYANDYKKAGLPTFTEVFNSRQIAIIAFILISITAVSSILIPFNSNFVSLCAFISAFLLILDAKTIFRVETRMNFLKSAFKKINIYAFLIILFLSVDRFLV